MRSYLKILSLSGLVLHASAHITYADSLETAEKSAPISNRLEEEHTRWLEETTQRVKDYNLNSRRGLTFDPEGAQKQALAHFREIERLENLRKESSDKAVINLVVGIAFFLYFVIKGIKKDTGEGKS
jgi:hypothetical protein